MAANSLHGAARSGDLAELERLLSLPDGKAPDPDDKDTLGRTAMHLAAWAGHPDCIARLAKAGGDVNSKAVDEVTPLIFACQKGATGAVEALIVAKAGLEFTDKKKKNTPLHIACEKGFEEIIKALVDAGANTRAKNKAQKSVWDICKTDEVRMALPGGFSKLKGEKVGWKERDPAGFAQAQAELDAKKQEKLAATAEQRGMEKEEQAKPRHTISDEGLEEQGEDDESPFAVPASKPKSKEPAANKRPAPEEEGVEGAEAAGEQDSNKHAKVDIGPALPPPPSATETAALLEASAGPPPAAAPAPADDAPPCTLSSLMASQAEVEDMLIDDPDNDDLKDMLKQVEEAIAVQKAQKK